MYQLRICLALLCLIFATLISEAQTGVVLQNDFEDGTLQGWIPRGGGVVLTNTTEAANGGTHSLKTTGRTQGFQGPSLDLLGKVLKGATYQISASVRLVTGQPASTLKITVQRTPNGAANAFDQVASSANNGVTDAAWVTLQGQYSFGTDNTGLLLYVESSDATSQYYVDDFSITLLAPPPGGPQDNSGLRTNWESGTVEGWQPRIGRETLTATTADKHNGNYSLLTTGRQREFDGPKISVAGKMYNGSRYRVSVWVKLAPGEDPISIRVSLERTLGTSTTFHTVVPNTTVTADAWVLLTTVYDYAFNHTALNLYVENAAVTPVRAPSFYIDDFDITYLPPPEIERDIPSVFGTLSSYFPIGAAIYAGDISGVHSELLKKHFNSVTAENDMKPGSLHPTEATFNFAPADALVSFAKSNNMLVRGHTLVWHNQNPAWLFQDANGHDLQPGPESKALMLQRLESHIRGVVSHFKDDVYAWDVVNEVIDPSQADGFRRSQWYLLTGTDYIDRAFQVAHEVAPQAKLYINDYDTTNPVKRAFLLSLVSDLKKRGIPIDGVGHQMHNNIDYPSADSVIETINMFSGLGVDNQITELDISVYNNGRDMYSVVPEEVLIRQGYRYRDFFQAFRQLKGKISAVTFWGQADDHTWLKTNPITRLDLPLLFDESLKAKHAYWGVVDPLQLPGADLAVDLKALSSDVLTGQTVTYRATVTNNGHDPAFHLTLTDSTNQATVFQSVSAPPGWSCDTPEPGKIGQVTCTTDKLDTGASAQVDVSFMVTCITPDGTGIINTATVSSATLDPNPAPNNSASTSQRISNPPPTISGLAPDKSALTPADNKLVDVTLNYEITDNCNAGEPIITITSNQSTSGGFLGPVSDWEIVDAHHIRLRASKNVVARIYTIRVTVIDDGGSSSSAVTRVKVP